MIFDSLDFFFSFLFFLGVFFFFFSLLFFVLEMKKSSVCTALFFFFLLFYLSGNALLFVGASFVSRRRAERAFEAEKKEEKIKVNFFFHLLLFLFLFFFFCYKESFFSFSVVVVEDALPPRDRDPRPALAAADSSASSSSEASTAETSDSSTATSTARAETVQQLHQPFLVDRGRERAPPRGREHGVLDAPGLLGLHERDAGQARPRLRGEDGGEERRPLLGGGRRGLGLRLRLLLAHHRRSDSPGLRRGELRHPLLPDGLELRVVLFVRFVKRE